MTTRGLPLGVAHELGLALALSCAILLVVVGGELPAFAWLVVAAPWLSCALALTRRAVPALSGTLVGLAGVALGGATLAQAGLESAVLSLTVMVLGLLAGRVLSRRTRAHDTQAIGLSLVLVLAGSVLNVSVTFLPLFVLYAVASVWALATRQLLAGAASAAGPTDATALESTLRARTDVVTPTFFLGTGAVALAVLVAAGALFLAFPRVGLGDIGAFLQRKSKLPSSVGLRGNPRALGGNEVVARVDGVSRDEWDAGLYLRGAVYDVVTLDGFEQSKQPAKLTRGGLELAPAPTRAHPYTVTVAPSVGDHALVLGASRYARTISGGSVNTMLTVGIVGRNAHDEIVTAAALDAPLKYEVLGEVAQPSFIPTTPPKIVPQLDRASSAQAPLFALPLGFDDALGELARTAASAPAVAPDERTSEAIDREVSAMRAFLLGNFVYSLDPPRFADRPLRAFLLDERQGHCEFFAAAFALLLRSRGVAARVVGGYQGGLWDDGVVVFQQRHAHAWVEWFKPGFGWIVDDATPVPNAPREELTGFATLVERVRRLWDERVLDYALDDQLAALSKARRATPSSKRVVGAIAAIVIGLGALAAIRRVRFRRRTDPSAPLARALQTATERIRARPIAASDTLREAVLAVPAARDGTPDPRAILLRALDAYEQSRFGGQELAPDELRQHLRALKTVRPLRAARSGRDSPA